MMRARRAPALLLAFLLGALGAAVAASTPGYAADPTTVAVAIVTATPVAVGSTVTVRATVRPAGATGQVTFTVDERAVATVAIASGTATASFQVAAAGQFLVRASYTPEAGAAGFTAARSSNTTLVVGTGASMVVQNSAGAPIPAGASVTGGSTVKLAVQGFPARTSLRFTIGAASLAGSVSTDSRGAATLTTRLPGLDAREYVVVAYGGQRTAIATVLIDGVAPGATPTPTFCPASPTGTPTPTSSSPRPTSSSPRPTSSSPRPSKTEKATSTRSQSPTRTDDDSEDGGGRGGPGDLPRTGAAVLTLLVIGGVAVAFGTGLISFGRRRPVGRHVR